MYHRQTPQDHSSPRTASQASHRRRNVLLPAIVVVTIVACILGVSLLIDMHSRQLMTQVSTKIKSATSLSRGTHQHPPPAHGRVGEVVNMDPDSSEIVGHFDVSNVTEAAAPLLDHQQLQELPVIDPATLTTLAPPTSPPPTPQPPPPPTNRPPTVVYHPTPAPPPLRPGSELLAAMNIRILTPRKATLTAASVAAKTSPEAPSSDGTYAPVHTPEPLNATKAGLFEAYATKNLEPLEGSVCHIVLPSSAEPIDLAKTPASVWADDDSTLFLVSDPATANTTRRRTFVLDFARWAKVRRRFLKRLAKVNPKLKLATALEANESAGWFMALHFIGQLVKSADPAFAKCHWFAMVHTNAFVRTRVLEKAFLSKINHGQILRVGIDTTFKFDLSVDSEDPPKPFAYATAAAGIAFSRGLLDVVDTYGCARNALAEPSLLLQDDALIGYCLAHHTAGSDSAPEPSFVGTMSAAQTAEVIAAASGKATFSCRECTMIAHPIDLALAQSLAADNARIAWGRACGTKSCDLLLRRGLKPVVGASWPSQDANMSAMIRLASMHAADPPAWVA